MGLVVADRVKETTTTTGTGTINLAGAATQFQSFISAVGNGNQCNYCILGGDGTDWETGIGTVTSGSPNTLSRTTILASSNSGSAISLTGTSTVFLTEPASVLTTVMSAPLIPPPIASSWTQRNFSGSTSIANVATGVQIVDSSGATSTAFRAATMASPSTPYTIDANFSGFGLIGASSGFSVAMGWTDTTKYQLSVANAVGDSGNFGENIVANYSNATTFSAVASSVRYGSFSFNNFWLRIADNGTNVTFGQSHDGFTFITIYTVAKSSGYLGSSGYSNVVWAIDGNMGTVGLGSVTLRSWYQH